MSESPARKPFKDWFDAPLVVSLGQRLVSVEPAFDLAAFRDAAVPGLERLELKARVAQIADALHVAMPGPVTRNLNAIVAALPDPLPTADGVTNAGFPLWPFSDYIATHGLADVDTAFRAMIALTKRFSSEFAIRPFLAADLDGTLHRLEALVDDPDLHVRRWVSEGTRTRLPWGAGVPGLAAALPRRVALLDALRHDPEPYVRRSVANHMGDILKDDIDAGLDILRRWQADDHPATDWIVRHAARTPLKAGHPGALALFGHAPLKLKRTTFSATPARVEVGDTVSLRAELAFAKGASGSVRIDYALVSPGRSGRPSRKVFRWADREAGAGTSIAIETTHAFIPRSIRAVHPGRHRFELIVNGETVASSEVEVSPP
jgi:3-methyladenine DNA glycosylase AlkC